jgi:hypothetical protein
MLPSQGILLKENENSITFMYPLEMFPDVQNLLKEIREETKLEGLNFEEPIITLVFQKNL